MTFVVNTIKQAKTTSENTQITSGDNIELLLDIEDISLARKFIEKTSLVLLSIEKYVWDVSTFWHVYAIIPFEDQQIRVVWTNSFNLKTLFSLFLSLWFDVIDGNYFDDLQQSEQIQKVLFICKKEVLDSKHEEKYILEKQQEKERKIYYQSQDLDKAKEVIERTLNKVDFLLLDREAFISSKDRRSLKEKTDEIKKLRMWTNYEKMKDILWDIFLLIDHIDEEYYKALQSQSTVLFSWTSVTFSDVEKEILLVELMKKWSLLGGYIPSRRKDYISFWQTFSYLLFIKKDFLTFLGNIFSYFYRIFDFIQIGSLIIIVFLSISIIYFLLFSPITSLNFIYYQFFSLWFLWLLNYLFSLLKIKNPLLFIVFFGIMLVSYYILLSLLKHSFVLF